jgi:hypothetical protein
MQDAPIAQQARKPCAIGGSTRGGFETEARAAIILASDIAVAREPDRIMQMTRDARDHRRSRRGGRRPTRGACDASRH